MRLFEQQQLTDNRVCWPLGRRDGSEKGRSLRGKREESREKREEKKEKREKGRKLD